MTTSVRDLQPLPDSLLQAKTLRNRAAVAGLDALVDEELLALLLSPDCCGEASLRAAQRLLASVGGLHRLSATSVGELTAVLGIGPVRALRVLAGLQLGRRGVLRESALCSSDSSTQVSYEAVVRWARPRLVPLKHEEVWLLSLDARYALRSTRRVAQGGRHGCSVLPADILRPAVADAASAIVLVHNHPSGEPTPSHADYAMTSALDRACQLLGLQLLDHIVVARRGDCSLKGRAKSQERGRSRRCAGFEPSPAVIRRP